MVVIYIVKLIIGYILIITYHVSRVGFSLGGVMPYHLEKEEYLLAAIEVRSGGRDPQTS